MEKIIVKADKNGIPTEIKMTQEHAEILYAFMEGFRLGFLESERFAEDLQDDIKGKLGVSAIKEVSIDFNRPNPKLLVAYVVREKYADKEASDIVVDYEKFYNLLAEEIWTLIGEKIDMENTIAYDN